MASRAEAVEKVPRERFDPPGREAREVELAQARAAALEVELAAAARAARGAAASHQAEIERLQAELVEAKRAVVAVQQSSSWRLTSPLRAAGQLLRRRSG